MFDVSFQEVFLILLVALLVIGPERLPKVARTLGLWVGRARAMFNTMRNEVEREIHLDELRKTEQQLKRDLDLNKELKDLDQDLKQDLSKDLESGPERKASADGGRRDQRKEPATAVRDGNEARATDAAESDDERKA